MSKLSWVTVKDTEPVFLRADECAGFCKSELCFVRRTCLATGRLSRRRVVVNACVLSVPGHRMLQKVEMQRYGAPFAELGMFHAYPHVCPMHLRNDIGKKSWFVPTFSSPLQC